MFKQSSEGFSYTNPESQDHYQEHARHTWHEYMCRKLHLHGSIKQ